MNLLTLVVNMYNINAMLLVLKHHLRRLRHAFEDNHWARKYRPLLLQRPQPATRAIDWARISINLFYSKA